MEESLNYQRIAKAIAIIRRDFKSQPSLDEVAAEINLSPMHFQRLFSEWAGVSPKKFLQYISINYAKSLLRTEQMNLFHAAHETGLSGTGRLHDLFVTIEGMTPGEYQHGGKQLQINYSRFHSPFGSLLIASTTRGICHLAFEEDAQTGFQKLVEHFPNASFKENQDTLQQKVISFFINREANVSELKLHLKGSPFQLKVWESLLKIPEGKLTTYLSVAQEIGNAAASRAVGTAIGKNPIAFLIPCHRVIQSSGELGGYMWGMDRKMAMIGWEAAKNEHPNVGSFCG